MRVPSRFMEIELAYASAEKQLLLTLEVIAGTTIRQAIQQANLADFISVEPVAVGIFGQQRSLDWPVKAGDRVEIYRPLRLDPMAARLERAKLHRQLKQKK